MQGRTKMTQTPLHQTNPHTEHAHVIAHLSDELNIPAQDVDMVFREQIDHLAAGARIKTFIGVLAVRRTRAVLRDRTSGRTGGLHS
jgi:Protein of unknown function (DUF3562)